MPNAEVLGVIGETESTVEELQKKFPLLDRDIDFVQLVREITLLPISFKQCCPHVKKLTSTDTVIDFMNIADMKQAYSQFHLILKLYLTIPMSNATSERGFSTLRRVKSYLRTTLTQQSLNHLVILHAHKTFLDKLSMKNVERQFIEAVPKQRRSYFGSFGNQ